jgi:hypothetical protein
MPHQADYVLIVSDAEDYLNGFHYFAELVNRKLRAGYVLHGAPFHIGHVLYQAMVRPATAANMHDQATHESAPRTSSSPPATRAHSTGKN